MRIFPFKSLREVNLDKPQACGVLFFASGSLFRENCGQHVVSVQVCLTYFCVSEAINLDTQEDRRICTGRWFVTCDNYFTSITTWRLLFISPAVCHSSS